MSTVQTILMRFLFAENSMQPTFINKRNNIVTTLKGKNYMI